MLTGTVVLGQAPLGLVVCGVDYVSPPHLCCLLRWLQKIFCQKRVFFGWTTFPMATSGERSRINALISRQLAAPAGTTEPSSMQELCDLASRGLSDDILLAIKEPMKHGALPLQMKAFVILDELIRGSTPDFTIALSQDDWTERLFRLAKTTEHPSLRDYIMARCIGWTRLYGTSGFRSLLARFTHSKVLGEPYALVHREEERKESERRRAQDSASAQYADPNRNDSRRSTRPAQNTSSSSGGTASRERRENVDTFMMTAQSDLANLEIGLENPGVLGPNTVSDCESHKARISHYLTMQGFPADTKESMLLLLEQLTQLLGLWWALNPPESPSTTAQTSRHPPASPSTAGQRASPAAPSASRSPRAVAVDDDDDEEPRGGSAALRRVISGGDYDTEKNRQEAAALAAMQAAQAESQQRLQAERRENAELSKKLEQALRQVEDVQAKYQHAKQQNKKACDAYEQTLAETATLNERLQQLEAAAVAKSTEPPPKPQTVTVVQTIKPKVSGGLLRSIEAAFVTTKRTVRDLREQARALRKDSDEMLSQAKVAVSSIAATIEGERAGDVKAFQKMQDLYKKEMKLRKQYYNTIQELKGNIRVYCRVRPMSEMELQGGHSDIVTFPVEDELRIIDNLGKPRSFEFDNVYDPRSTQQQVFEDTCPLIDSVIDGYNVCIFAYGQTGSGKTHTMSGADVDRGINRRALDRLFECLKEREANEEASVNVSVLEIYNENIRDLLVPKLEALKQTYEVRMGGPYGQYVSNLTERPVACSQDVQEILNRATANRSEGSTNMNLHSSRSHMILYVLVKTQNRHTGVQSFGKLSLVDLAGSERLDKSGATGDAAKEAVAINKSLTALGDVIAGLSQGAKHVPFRNSILTYLLQDSMAGQAKVLMFCCVSPASYNMSETISSLGFASRARGVSLGPVKKNPQS